MDERYPPGMRDTNVVKASDHAGPSPNDGSDDTEVRVVTVQCTGPKDDQHEPTTMETTQNDSIELRHECPKCGVVVLG